MPVSFRKAKGTLPSKRTLVFYYINENEGGLDSIYKEDGLEYWMCPSGISLPIFDAKEDAIWTALAAAYNVKKDGLTIEEIFETVRKICV